MSDSGAGGIVSESDELLHQIATAIHVRRFEEVVSPLARLALVDPRLAAEVYELLTEAGWTT